MIEKLAFVAVGGAAGAVLRFLVSHASMRLVPGLPVGTFLVNVVGSLAMGVVAVWLIERGALARFAPLLMTGLLGGFTTFSAFSLDAWYLLERGRFWVAVGYIGLSVVLSIAALAVGLALGRRWFL
ncbi:MAG: fluoride efflux transporter CrcB [Pseudomonadota bacterium]